MAKSATTTTSITTDTRTKATVVQNAMGQPVRVRVGGGEFPVMSAAEIYGLGQKNLVLTIADVDVVLEPEQPAAAAA